MWVTSLSTTEKGLSVYVTRLPVKAKSIPPSVFPCSKATNVRKRKLDDLASRISEVDKRLKTTHSKVEQAKVVFNSVLVAFCWYYLLRITRSEEIVLNLLSFLLISFLSLYFLFMLFHIFFFSRFCFSFFPFYFSLHSIIHIPLHLFPLLFFMSSFSTPPPPYTFPHEVRQAVRLCHS